MELTPIQEFYKGRSVLITGATGFCGKALLEKLLRSCPDIGNIYLLMRPKAGQDVITRLAHLFEDPVFDNVKQRFNGTLESKVFAIAGDITELRLGMSEENRERLQQEVSVVFHVAATIRFNENLKVALQTNVMGTQEVVDLCKQMPLLAALVYVSTAYSQHPLQEVEEKVYPPSDDPRRLCNCINWMSESEFSSIEPMILRKWPNTYTYSKALAEHVINENGGFIPVAIFRPSIVLSTWREPIPGWIININGPTMGVLGSSMGMIRCGHVNRCMITDIVPVDATVNALIAVAWETAIRRQGEAKVYNFVSGAQHPITWGEYFDSCRKFFLQNPPLKAKWYYTLFLSHRRFVFHAVSFLLDFIPACLMDIVSFLTTGQHKYIKLYLKSLKFLHMASRISTNEWKFHDTNVRSLLSSLSSEDKKIFYFDVTQLQWQEYLSDYVAGIRLYLMKDKPTTLDAARKRYRKLHALHIVVQLGIVLLFFRITRIL